MTDTQKLRVFLSYTHADVSPIRELYQNLSAQGYEVWFDEENLIPGQEWRTEIERALEKSDVVVVCLSNNSVSREGFVQKEFRYAMEKALEMTEDGIFLIPVRLDDCKVPPKLSRYHWVDLFTANGFARLQKALALRASQVAMHNQIPTPPVIVTPPPSISFNAKKTERPKRPITTPRKKDPVKPVISTQDVKPTSFSLSTWSLTYLPILPAIIFLLAGMASPTEFKNTALYAILAILISSLFQWRILRSHFEKAIRWVLFNFLLSVLILASHGVLESVYEGLFDWVTNSQTTFRYYAFWALSFWVIIIVWAGINGYTAFLISRSNVKIKHFFTDAKLNISFWNLWGTVLLVGFPVTSIVMVWIINAFSIEKPFVWLFGGVGAMCGFLQWLILRRHLKLSWWIVANLIFGMLFGSMLDVEPNLNGFLIDDLVLLFWFTLNFSLGPLLIWYSTGRRRMAMQPVKAA